MTVALAVTATLTVTRHSELSALSRATSRFSADKSWATAKLSALSRVMRRFSADKSWGMR